MASAASLERSHLDASRHDLNDPIELSGTKPHHERNEPFPPVITPPDPDFSLSPFSTSDLSHALSRWQSVLQDWFEETEKRDSRRRDSKLHESLIDHI